MGFFNRVFRRPEQSEQLSPEMRAVFDKVCAFMNDEAAQNRVYLEEVRRLITDGADVDRIAGGVGEFGRDLGNPIPVNGVLGELLYISQLVTHSGSRLIGHRLGSISRIDVYEVVSLDSSVWDVLFFDLYHPRKSRLAPTGHDIEPDVFLLATNYFLDEFPNGIRAAVSRSAREFIRLPMVSPKLFDDEGKSMSPRPAEHAAVIRRLRAKVQE